MTLVCTYHMKLGANMCIVFKNTEYEMEKVH